MRSSRLPSRRRFLTVAAPYVLTSVALGAQKRPPASDRIVTGHIGVGGLGIGYHLRYFLAQPDVQVAAVCDVDARHRERARKAADQRTGAKSKVAAFGDFRQLLDRRDVDAVIIATPDHWHALPAVGACQAGKDVYCEKPLALTIDEGKAMVQAAQRYGRITQTGTQQRSSGHFRQVCEWVRNGRIGHVHTCRTSVTGNPGRAHEAPRKPPKHLDWDFWLGAAPWTEYVPSRCHGSFRWYRDYSGGKLTDWGVHLNDIIQWGMGTDHTGPVLVEGKGQMALDNAQYEWPDRMEVRYEFEKPDFTLYYHQPDIPDEPRRSHGMKFYGTRGAIFVDRSGFQCHDKGGHPREPLEPTAAGEVHLFRSPGHQRHWLDCVKSRQQTFDPWEIGHRSTTLSHLGNISYLLGRPVRWDPKKQLIPGDDVANRMLSRPYRAPWCL